MVLRYDCPMGAREHVAPCRGRFGFYFVRNRGSFRLRRIIDFVLRGVLMSGCYARRFVINMLRYRYGSGYEIAGDRYFCIPQGEFCY